jgi:hypothetical protein
LCPEIWPAKGACLLIAIIWPRHSVFWSSRLARRLLQTATPGTGGRETIGGSPRGTRPEREEAQIAAAQVASPRQPSPLAGPEP